MHGVHSKWHTFAFTCSAYCSCPHRVHTVARSMHTTGTCVCCAPWTSTPMLFCWSLSMKFWSKSSHLHSIIHFILCSNTIVIYWLNIGVLTLKCAVILSISCQRFALSLLCLSSCKTCDVCDVFSAAQRIVGQNGQKNLLVCIMQNPTGCSRTSWYFWHNAFHILCTGTCLIFFWRRK